VRTVYLSRFEIRTVSGSIHQEYWLPAEELPNFNASIVGGIEIIAEFLTNRHS